MTKFWILFTIIFLIVFLVKMKSIERFQKFVLCEDHNVPRSDQKLTEAIIYRPAPLHDLSSLRGFREVSKSKIPKKIFQTNEKDLIPVGMKRAIESILRLNPDYEYCYLTNLSARKFLKLHFPEKVLLAYKKLKPGAYKADLFRYCILYHFGGIYIDSAMVCKANLDKLIGPEDTFICPEDEDSLGLYNAFICSEPESPILREAIEMCLSNIENDFYGQSDLEVTGPWLLAKAFEKVTGIKPQQGISNNGIKIIKHTRTEICTTGGKITDLEGKIFFDTKYNSYSSDRKWYNTAPHYSILWKDKNIYNL